MDPDIPLTNWPKENIPDRSSSGKDYLLFRRIHKIFIKSNTPDIIAPSAFRDNGEGISTNWSKYATALKTKEGLGIKPIEDYSVVSLIIRKIREKEELSKLKIEHAPVQQTKNTRGNRAHTNIIGILEYGEMLREAQVHLSRLAKWEINEKIGLG